MVKSSNFFGPLVLWDKQDPRSSAGSVRGPALWCQTPDGKMIPLSTMYNIVSIVTVQYFNIGWNSANLKHISLMKKPKSRRPFLRQNRLQAYFSLLENQTCTSVLVAIIWVASSPAAQRTWGEQWVKSLTWVHPTSVKVPDLLQGTTRSIKMTYFMCKPCNNATTTPTLPGSSQYIGPKVFSRFWTYFSSPFSHFIQNSNPNPGTCFSHDDITATFLSHDRDNIFWER